LGDPLLALVLFLSVTAHTGAQTTVNDQITSQLVGTWSGQRGSSDFVLVLKAGGEGWLNALNVRWIVSGANLSLATPKRNFHYRFSVSGDSLTLSGSDLKHPLAFTRIKEGQAAALDSNQELPIAGNPPLTEDIVERGTQFFEWLLDAQLTLEQRAEFRGSLVRSWKTHQQDDIDSTMNVLRFQQQLKSRRPEERSAIREQLRQNFLAQMRQTPTAVLSRWVLNIYNSAHRPIATGNPPLTPQVADAYAEFVSFMLTQCSGKTIFNADRHFKDALARSLAAQYSSYSPEQQRQFSQVPLLWEVLRFKWAQLSESQRAEYRQQWTQTAQALMAGVSTGANAGQAAADSSGSSSLQNYVNNYSEHLFVQSMASSSFATTMNLHLNMWR
jgi:hypothetical protein